MDGKYAALLPSLLALVLALSGCSDTHVDAASAPDVVRKVPVVTAQIAHIPDLLEASGTVSSAETSSLASQIMGTIVEVRVHEGDRVQPGQVLVVIDEAQPQAAFNRAVAAETAAGHEIEAAESELALAESTFKRYQILYDKKVISPLEFEGIKSREQSAVARRDLARAALEQAKAELTQARTTLEYTRIRAPYDGVVTERKLDPGALASPGFAILTVEQLGHYRLEVSINEGELRYIHMGDEVPITIDALGSFEGKGRVAQIVPSADPASRSFLIKLDLPSNPQLRSGEFGTAEFSRGERASLIIPQTAVIQRGQLQGAYVLDGRKIATLRYITLGKTAGVQVEVLAGLESGEAVVANPGGLELSGKQIESQP
jgi:RND family efflux transporter MFP subunit